MKQLHYSAPAFESTTLDLSSKQILETATSCILNEKSNRKDLVTAVHTLYTLFSTISKVYAHEENALYSNNTMLPDGLAVSPQIASKCLLEPYRTIRFLRGIHAAIHEALLRFSPHPIRILYAGCGPYATLLLPFMTQFTPEQIQITLLDIHESSLAAVERLVQVLGGSHYIENMIQADATTYEPEESEPFHLLVIEMLQGALQDEMQVAATLHLRPFLHEQGFLIPQNVTVSACVTSQQRENFGTLIRRAEDGFPVDHSALLAQRIDLGVLFCLNAETAVTLHQQRELYGNTLAPAQIIVPILPSDSNQFMLVTTINIFADIVIHNYQSDVCHPVILYELKQLSPGMRLDFVYRLGKRPQFNYQSIVPA